MCQTPRGNCLPLPFPASACRFLSCRHPHTPPYSSNRNYFPSPLQAHDASRMWMSVPVLHPAAPMAPAPTFLGASGASAMGDTLALSVIRTLTTVPPVSAGSYGGASPGNPPAKPYMCLAQCCCVLTALSPSPRTRAFVPPAALGC